MNWSILVDSMAVDVLGVVLMFYKKFFFKDLQNKWSAISVLLIVPELCPQGRR